MTQKIEQSLLDEFEKELEKKLIKPQLDKIALTESESLDEFWKKFLSEDFPNGKINEMLEKNFAIYICQNNLDIENVKDFYLKNNWSLDGLLGWVKKVRKEELQTFNIKELLIWANTFAPKFVSLLETAKAELEEEQLPVIPIDELDNLPEQENIWLCDRIIRPKSINALSGKRASLKTWLLLYLSVCLSSQISFLEKFKTETSNVLFLDGESNKDELKKRKNLIKKYLNVDNLPNFFVVSEHYLKIDSKKAVEQLEKQIKKLNIKLIILDSYRRFISFDENDATKTSAFFIDMIKPICYRTGVSFLFIQHDRKGKSDDEMDDMRGSSDFANLMDSVLKVSRDGNKLTIKQTKNKFGKEIPEFNIQLETDEKTYFGFRFLGLKETSEIVCAKTLLKWLREKKTKSFTYTKAWEYLQEKNFKESSFKKSLQVLKEKGLIQKGENKKSPYNVISTDWGAEEL